MKNLKSLFVFLLLNISVVVFSQFTTVPYFCGFENPEDTLGATGWKFVKRAKIGHSFVVGDAVHRLGSNAMYVSVDSGKTASYSLTASGSVVVAYKSFYLQKGKYDLMFDYRLQGEDNGDADVLRVAFYAAGTPPSAVAMNDFPAYAKDNPFTSKTGEQVFKTTLWTQVEGEIEAKEDGYYYLAFLFKEDGDKNIYAPGACIDNIQIDRVKSPTACATKPTNILIDKEPNGVKLRWSGHADSYEVMYYRVSSLNDTTYNVIKGITTEEYLFSYMMMQEGVYNFRVRALCENDTSLWVEKANYIFYDESKHCLNYMDFTTNGTMCYYGTFKNPAAIQKVYDYGYESRHSIHTVHYMEDEYDRLTGYKLKTVPEGQMASVRLGNWTEGPHGDSPILDAEYPGGAPSGQIVYTYTIPEDKSVLLLHYAAVLQYASNHEADRQTRIQVEVLGSRDRVLKCASADFNARDVTEGNTRGWETYQPKEGEVLNHECPIKWLNWRILGINLKDYVGQTVKIRITLNACEADYHFAYGYFVLDCTEGEVEGMSCTEKADTLFVPEGFNYRWYVAGDESNTLSTERFFVPNNDDITSYKVDLIYPEDEGCYITLDANIWPRVPVVDAEFSCLSENCVSYVNITNKSKIVDLVMDDEGNVIDSVDVSPSVVSVKDFYWEVKSDKGSVFENGTSVAYDVNPRIIASNDGDTFIVVLRGMFNGCEDVKEYEVIAPQRGASFTEKTVYVCDGKEVEFNGKTYTEPGVYIDTLKSVYGCDSILQLTLETLVTDTIRMDSVICSAKAPFKWFDKSLDSTGVYEHNIVSSMGCDSLYYILDLTILESLVLDIVLPVEICEDDDVFEIGYEAKSGDVSGYNIECADLNIAEEVLFDEDSVVGLVIDLPEEVKPNRYELDITFYNSDCGDLDTTLVIDVLYSKDVIAQRWNDVLALKNSTYNGGYEFIAYQWFLNGNPLDGFIGSQFYEAGKDLDFDGEYSVLLTRKEDGVSMMTCTFVPTQFSDSDLSNVGKLVFTNEIVSVESKQEAKCYIYNLSGLLYSVFDLKEGANMVSMPSREGMYLMVFDYIDREKEAIKIVVRN